MKSKSLLAALMFVLGCSAQVEVKTPKKEPPKVEAKAPEPAPPPEKPAYISISERIQFHSGQAVLMAQSLPTLDEVAGVLSQNPDLEVEIEGHTDSSGRSDMNRLLSQSRAEAVRDYLVRQRGIEAERLRPRGYGQDSPTADNSTYEGREQNRRVQFRIVNQDG